jgi:hypothetical protein
MLATPVQLPLTFFLQKGHSQCILLRFLLKNIRLSFRVIITVLPIQLFAEDMISNKIEKLRVILVEVGDVDESIIELSLRKLRDIR